MGVHLVEGRDLVCHGTDVFLRTTEGEVPVHVIYRRIDDDYLDPLQFRPESLVGCPGVVNAARAGRVTIANGVGNGVADDKLVYTYVPAMIRYYLGEDPILQNVETMHLVDDAVRKDALARRGDLVFKRVDGSGGKGLVIGPAATGAELDELALEVEADPRHWIAQRVVALSTSPTWVDNAMVRRHVDLRPFAVNDGEDIWVLPGGLTRVALGRAAWWSTPARAVAPRTPGSSAAASPCRCSRRARSRRSRPVRPWTSGRRPTASSACNNSNSSNSSSRAAAAAQGRRT